MTDTPSVTELGKQREAFLRERSRTELAIPHESDITVFDDLVPLLGRPVKVTVDGGQTWKYRLLDRRGPQYFRGSGEYTDDSFGIGATSELQPITGVHSRRAVMRLDMANGMVVRPVTLEELCEKGVTFSYGDDDRLLPE